MQPARPAARSYFARAGVCLFLALKPQVARPDQPRRLELLFNVLLELILQGGFAHIRSLARTGPPVRRSVLGGLRERAS